MAPAAVPSGLRRSKRRRGRCAANPTTTCDFRLQYPMPSSIAHTPTVHVADELHVSLQLRSQHVAASVNLLWHSTVQPARAHMGEQEPHGGHGHGLLLHPLGRGKP
jgi:hypothetical protein